MNKEQEHVFNDILQLAHTVVRLGSWFQNDFQTMLNNGDANINDLKLTRTKMEHHFDSVVGEINKLKERGVDVMDGIIVVEEKR